MKKKRDRAFWESAKRNNYTYTQYFNRLVELACSENPIVEGAASFDEENGILTISGNCKLKGYLFT